MEAIIYNGAFNGIEKQYVNSSLSAICVLDPVIIFNGFCKTKLSSKPKSFKIKSVCSRYLSFTLIELYLLGQRESNDKQNNQYNNLREGIFSKVKHKTI